MQMWIVCPSCGLARDDGERCSRCTEVLVLIVNEDMLDSMIDWGLATRQPTRHLFVNPEPSEE